MRFGSLFAGIGGIDLGLERAGMECAWQVEIDDYCQKVLQKHWPNVPKYGDIKEVDFERIERVDLICGGFPCQDLSYAGKGAGISGERSGLWSEFKRAIRESRPRYVLVENVPGLLGRGMGVVLGGLASLGYDAEWESLPASAFGAPHLRYRVYVVAYAQLPGLEGESRSGVSGKRRQAGLSSCRNSEIGGEWAPEPNVGRVAHGIPRRVDRLRGLGNAVVPQIAEWIGQGIMGVR